MATKSFLKDDELLQSSTALKPPGFIISGDEAQSSRLRPDEFSKWLQYRLLKRLSEHPSWRAAGPIALGSWSRDELSPKSDVDLLFVGNEDDVLKLTTDFSKQGLKLRYRMPEDPSDWTIGVEPFDILALITAVPLTNEVSTELEKQKEKLRANWKAIRKAIVKAMAVEREARNERYDSITSYLEPNLKYGSGGLRDLEQALALKTLFPERFETAEQAHAFAVLSYYKKFFLLVRQKLHLSQGASDLLIATEQASLAAWLGFKNPRDFMKEIQKGFARVSFYADWAFEQVAASTPRLAKIAAVKLKSPKDLFKALRDDPSVLMQNRVRLVADSLFAESLKKENKASRAALQKLIGRELTNFIDPAKPEKPLIALFRSRLVDHCVPEFRRIVGHVQHDQYHRFSVDAHILQALRELGRLRKSPKLAGKLSRQLKSLTKGEWEILSFACLYHDIAKGREGDHSIEGIAVAQQDLTSFGKSEALIREVAWIVEEHLILSSAAFKENPASPKTWAKLAAKGVANRRVPLLAAFTIVDIRATNPDAWTPWKERLLNDVITNLENPEATNAIEFTRLMGEDSDWVERLDSFLVSMLSPQKLADDLKSVIADLSGPSVDLLPKIVRTKSGQTWIRFHSAHDRPGLFAHYVRSLGAAGLSIRHASVHTFRETGVYDWFEVKTEKSAGVINKLLHLALAKPASAPKTRVHFDLISLTSETNEEWVISFRGKDQPGALLQAANALFEQGAEIQWARVHTWGRQIDDVFGIKPLTGLSTKILVEKLIDALSKAISID